MYKPFDNAPLHAVQMGWFKKHLQHNLNLEHAHKTKKCELELSLLQLWHISAKSEGVAIFN